ncbi:MAG TPA: hypothetical protein VMT00_13055 [Thermoanaerobaculia bacterium]|nr:hypothetical protein [Thermoanaerobaculia bacterium]
MDKHHTIAAVLLMALGVLGSTFAGVLFVAIAGGGLLSGDSEAIAVTWLVASVLATIVLVFSLPALLGGIGLLRGSRWGRFLALLAGALNLVVVPFGTAIGIYTLYVVGTRDAAPSSANTAGSLPVVRE